MTSSLCKELDSLLAFLENIPSQKDEQKSTYYSVEICIDSVKSAYNAFNGGANRVELCSSLLEGGLTPSIGTIIQVLKCVPKIDVHVMIRPRNGDFLYDKNEMDIILNDIQQIIKLKQSNLYPNLKGIVSGFVDENGNIDANNLQICLKQIHNTDLQFTFHRAFDMTIDAIKSLNICINCGVNRILTSGLNINVEKGLKCILDMIKYCKDNNFDNKIIIAIGGGINIKNIGNFVNERNKYLIRHIHGTFRSVETGNMKYKKLNIFMGAKTVNGVKLSEYDNKYANVDMIKQIVHHMKTVFN
eukprot:199459_1